jgi:hypothetical protein
MKNFISMIATVGLLTSFLPLAASAKGKKKTYSAAKSECLAEDATLTGKNLQDCIKKKRK